MQANLGHSHRPDLALQAADLFFVLHHRPGFSTTLISIWKAWPMYGNVGKYIFTEILLTSDGCQVKFFTE